MQTSTSDGGNVLQLRIWPSMGTWHANAPCASPRLRVVRAASGCGGIRTSGALALRRPSERSLGSRPQRVLGRFDAMDREARCETDRRNIVHARARDGDRAGECCNFA